MSSVSVTVNGKRYPIACENGQEAHLSRLAVYVDNRLKEIAAAVGRPVSDDLLLVMTSLVIADELSDLYSRRPHQPAEVDRERQAAALGALASRLEAIANRAERS